MDSRTQLSQLKLTLAVGALIRAFESNCLKKDYTIYEFRSMQYYYEMKRNNQRIINRITL